MHLLKDSVLAMKHRINEELTKKNALKFYISLHANFNLASDESFMTEPAIVLSSDAVEIYRPDNLEEVLDVTFTNLVALIENFQQRESGWVLDKLMKLDLHVLEFDPLRSSSYIQLRKELQNSKKALSTSRIKMKCVFYGR